MNMAQPSISRQTLVAVGVFFAVLIGTCVWGISFVVANHHLQSEFEAKSEFLENLKKRTVGGVTVNGVMTDMRAAAVTAATETLAASELHRNILATLERSGGAVHSIQAEATTDTIGEGLRRLNAQVAFDSSIDSLQKILFQLETAMPFVFVDSITVQPAQSSAPTARPADQLRVTLSVSSYWRSSDADGSAADRKNPS